MGVPELKPDELAIPRNLEDEEGDLLGDEKVDELGVNTPLWYYVLKEAELQQDGERLGEVGGRIVAEVLLGLLDRDPLSFLSVQPNWTPELSGDDGQFTMADLIRFADPAAAEAHSGAPHDPQGESDCQRRADELREREQAAQAQV